MVVYRTPYQWRCNIVLASRNRLAAGLSLLLSLGTMANVLVLQGARNSPEPAVAETLPETPPGANSTSTPAARQAQHPDDLSAKTADPIGTLMSNADGDLALRTAEGAEAVASQATLEDGFASPKLISAIQRELAAHGYDPGRANGKAGVVTSSAILAFQFDQHLAMTAEPSDELLSQIVLGLTGSTSAEPEPPSDKASRIIGGAQRLLTRLGYAPGLVDGQLNEATRKALRRFEGDSGFVPKGRVSGEVISELARRAHARIEVSDEALTH